MPSRSKPNAADFRREAELAKHKNERKLARKQRVKTLSETLIRRLNQLTDTDMDERAIRAFQLKLQVPELLSIYLGTNAMLTNYCYRMLFLTGRS